MDLNDIRREVSAEAASDIPERDLAAISELMSRLYLTWEAPDEVIELLAPETPPVPSARADLGAATIAQLQAQAPDIGALLATSRQAAGLNPDDLVRAFGISEKELGWWEQSRGMVAFLDHSPAAIRQLTSRLAIEPGAFALGFATQLARQSVSVRRFTSAGADVSGARGRSVADWIRDYLRTEGS